MKIIGEKEAYSASSEIGGKARGLLLLRENGFNVPPFHLIDFDAIRSWKGDSKRVSAWIDAWKSECKITEKQRWAVRSSAAMEDGKTQSFAGQFTTKINVPTTDLSHAILEVLNSYSIESGYAEPSKSHGIIIQEMLSPDYSGVLFTKNPVDLLSDNGIINVIPGLGEKMVSGERDAFQIRFQNKDFIFENLEKQYGGEKFMKSELKKCTESGETIHGAIAPHLSTLVDGGFVLQEILKTPVDIEFVVQNGEVFWLQVRPMTNRALNENLTIWDNTNAEGNYPGRTLPLSISFTTITFEGAYEASARAIGFRRRILEQNEALIKRMSGGINGVLYYNLTAWQSNLYQLPFGKKFVRLLPQIWGMAEAPFPVPEKRHSFFERVGIFLNLLFKLLRSKKYERRYDAYLKTSTTVYTLETLGSHTYEELIQSYCSLRNTSAENWLAPILNGFYTMLIFFRLKRFIRKSKLAKSHPNFLNDILFAEGEVISVELVRSFQNLLQEIGNSTSLEALFKNMEPQQIWEELLVKHAEFHQKIALHISKYGERTSESELKMETINYKKDPLLFIAYLKSNAKGKVKKAPNQSTYDYQHVLKENYPYNFVKRLIFKRLIMIAIRRVKARENYRYTRMQVFALFREIFLQMGDRLQKQGAIDEKRDVLYLRVEELLNPNFERGYSALISNRKAEYLEFESRPIAVRYVQSDKGYFEIPDESIEAQGNQLKGIGCCSGTVEGKIVLIDQNTDLNQDFTNCILVAHYFEPGWISLFSQAKGIVSERGNLLSHTSIICRELNVPSIVGVKGLIAAIQNKKMLKMNGATGLIELDESL